MWDVGIRMADVTAEVKLELEVLRPSAALFTMLCCGRVAVADARRHENHFLPVAPT